MTANTIVIELKRHAPFTAFGAVIGIIVMALISHFSLPQQASGWLFWGFHPLHVVASAWVTTGMHRRCSGKATVRTALIGYLGSVGIATLSDCLIPYCGELLLRLPNTGLHLGVVEKWWLINPASIVGICLGCWRPITRFPHSVHVLLSTWASLFHMTMAMGNEFTTVVFVLVAAFLFLAVWVPCCTSDIVFPLLFLKNETEKHVISLELRRRDRQIVGKDDRDEDHYLS